ncbi:SKP1-like protein 11 [Capsicum chacoense]
MITLQSSDKDVFEIEQSILIQSGTIKNMVEDDFTFIPLPNVDTETLIKIIEYMKKHADKTDSKEEDIKEFDKDFVKKTLNELFALVFAANYLHISSLLELLYPSIADRIKDKTTEAIRQIFSIPCDFTPGEEKGLLWIISGHMKGQKLKELLIRFIYVSFGLI